MKTSAPAKGLLLLVALSLSAHLEAEDIRLTLGQAGSSPRLTWQGPPGWYVVQATSDLSSDRWRHLAMTADNAAEISTNERVQFLRVEYLSPRRVTVFSGGSLQDLQALSPSLEFDHLVITGRLKLPLWKTVTITANHLVVSRSGSIHSTRTPCEHGNEPSLVIRASGSVDVLGEIVLIGESGTRALPSSSCNTSSGSPGGNLDITAAEIQLEARIDISGGAGGTTVTDASGSTGHQGAAGGAVRLQAAVVRLDGAHLQTRGGVGGFGSSGGTAANGPAGQIVIQASDLVALRSRVETDGLLDVSAAKTDIYSPMISGRQNWNCNSASTDDQPPMIQVRSPRPNSRLNLGVPASVEIEVHDWFSGVREIEVKGLGLDDIYPAAEPIWTLEAPHPAPPAQLLVSVRDNSGNVASVTVAPIRLEGDLTVPGGVLYRLAEGLDLGAAAAIAIAGDVILPRGRQVKLKAGSFRLGKTGRVLLEDSIPATPSVPAALELDLAGSAVLDGTIDLTGYEGKNVRRSIRGPEKGGALSIAASEITISGQILVRGGRAGGSYQVWESSLGGVVNVGQSGADGGTIRLEAAGDIVFVDGGLMALEGGRESIGVNSPRPGRGGVVWMGSPRQQFAKEFDINAPSVSFLQLTGDQNLLHVKESEGTLLGKNNAVATAEPIPLFTELERAIWVGAPVALSGTIAPEDKGALVVTFDKGVETDIEDLFRLTIPDGLPAELELDIGLSSGGSADLDLLVFEAGTLELLGASEGPGPGEALRSLVLAPGAFVVGVVWSDKPAASPVPYTLTFSFALAK